MSSNIIHLISGPRNISTALMYSFGNRNDCNIVDEPFYAHYLLKTGLIHPGHQEIIVSMETDEEAIKNTLIRAKTNDKYLFVKNMAHHVMETDFAFINDFTNVFLIRNTTQIISSFSKVIPNPTLMDIGIKQEWELYQYLIKTNQNPVVIDSGLLLENPKSVITQLCNAIDLPFDNDMLSWSAGARKEDGIWAKHWYKNVHQTTCFKKQESSNRPLSDSLQEINKEAYFYYEKLFCKAIKP